MLTMARCVSTGLTPCRLTICVEETWRPFCSEVGRSLTGAASTFRSGRQVSTRGRGGGGDQVGRCPDGSVIR